MTGWGWALLRAAFALLIYPGFVFLLACALLEDGEGSLCLARHGDPPVGGVVEFLALSRTGRIWNVV